METERQASRSGIPGSWRAPVAALLSIALPGLICAQGESPPAAPSVELRLTVGGESFKAGERVPCKLEIVNNGPAAATFDPQEYFPFRVLRVVRRDGAPDWFIGPTPQTEGRDQELAPGASSTLWENVDAAELFLLEGGEYSIYAEHRGRARGKSLKSNEVSIAIKGGDLPYRKTILKRLRTAAPDGWTVQTSGSAVTVLHSPTGLKKDISSIQIWFTDAPLPADFELGSGEHRQEVATLGKTKLGFTHFALSRLAANHWPRCREILPLIFVDEEDGKKPRDDR